MRGELFRVMNPRQDKGTTTRSETEFRKREKKTPTKTIQTKTTKPTTDVKLEGGEEACMFEKEGKYSFADLCIERRKAWGAIILKDGRK